MPDVADARARLEHTFHIAPGPIADELDGRASEAEQASEGLWRRDASVWSADANVQTTILNRLGWLKSPQVMADALDRLLAFAESVKQAGFTDVVLLGMGGSSLAPEVLRGILGVAPGFPRLHMLDSTDPAAIAAATTPPDPARRSSPTRSPRISDSGSKPPGSSTGRVTSWRSPTKGPSSRRARARTASAISSSIRRTSAAATRRCRSSVSSRRP
jgi:hypothetical protein